jgi:hypothetical protein
MKHKMHVAHHTHGRLRMRVPAAKGNPSLCEELERVFSGLPGIKSVDARAETGSIVLHYFPHSQSELHDHLSPHIGLPPVPAALSTNFNSTGAKPGDEFEEATRKIQAEAEFLAGHSHSAQMIVDFCKDVDRHIKVSTNNAVDLKIVLAVGLTVLTFVEIGAAAATPMWVTLGLFALNHFAELQQQNRMHGAPLPAVYANAPAR